MTTQRLQSRHGRTGPSRIARIGSIGLTLASVGGLVCLAMVAVAVVFKITLIMFSTGSMSPTIPAGSVAVVKQIAAAEIRVGDVVTVDRHGQLPITHRVISVESHSDEEGAPATFTMQGDANAVPDAEPYTATKARLVLFSIPGLAPLIVAASQPLVLGGISIAAAALITWAFWPREETPRHGRFLAQRRDKHQPSAVDSERGTRTRMTTMGSVLVVVALVSAPALAPDTAIAAEQEQTIQGKWITLTSIGDSELMGDVADGAVVPWQVGVSSSAKEPGRISIALGAAGAVRNGLDVRIRVCTLRWVENLCSGAEREILPKRDVSLIPRVRDVRDHLLTTMSADTERWLLVEVSAPSDAGTGGSTVLSVHAWGAGDAVSTPVSPGLPGVSGDGAGGSATDQQVLEVGQLAGTGVLPVLVLPIIVAIGVGAAALIARARRRAANRREQWGRTPR